MTSNRSAGLLLAVLLACGISRVAFGCECADLPSDAVSRLQRAHIVFLGRAEEVSAGGRHVRFRVAWIWKGSPGQEIILDQLSEVGSCGFRFEPGACYIVYSWKEGGTATTNMCAGNLRQDSDLGRAAIKTLDVHKGLRGDAPKRCK
jgi:hypothetical protein